MAITKYKSKKNRFLYQVDFHYKDPFGITQRHIKSGFPGKRAAIKYEASLMELVNTNVELLHNKNMTIDNVFDEFFEFEGNQKYAPATQFYYKQTHQGYIRNKFGKAKIEMVDYVSLQKHINSMAKKFNYPTIKNMLRVYNVTFKYAMRSGYVYDNPVEKIQIPVKVPKVHREIISDANLKSLIDNIKPEYKRMNSLARKAQFTYESAKIALIIGRYTGLRISEVLALKKEDFDLDNHQLNVCRRLEYAGLKKSEMYFTEKLKTTSSKSKVEIGTILSDQLKEWFEINPYDLVICDQEGDFVSPAVLNSITSNASIKLGINFHFHMLRHTYATELMMSGANPIVVKDLMRHSKVTTTWDVYTHAENDEQRLALDSLYGD